MNQSENAMPRSVSALAARTQFGQIMRRAAGKKQERFIVDKRGEPKVVIMGVQDFLKTIAPEPAVLAAIRAESVKNKTDKLSLRQIDREIAAYRKERRLKNAPSKRRFLIRMSSSPLTSTPMGRRGLSLTSRSMASSHFITLKLFWRNTTACCAGLDSESRPTN